MNFIAGSEWVRVLRTLTSTYSTGFLLIILREEEAFWVLCTIVEALLPNYFTPDMIAIRVDCQILEDLAWQRMGGVMKHLSLFGSQILQISTLQWFLCLFIGMRGPSGSLPLSSQFSSFSIFSDLFLTFSDVHLFFSCYEINRSAAHRHMHALHGCFPPAG